MGYVQKSTARSPGLTRWDIVNGTDQLAMRGDQKAALTPLAISTLQLYVLR